jgi:hypothetical protein
MSNPLYQTDVSDTKHWSKIYSYIYFHHNAKCFNVKLDVSSFWMSFVDKIHSCLLQWTFFHPSTYAITMLLINKDWYIQHRSEVENMGYVNIIENIRGKSRWFWHIAEIFLSMPECVATSFSCLHFYKAGIIIPQYQT